MPVIKNSGMGNYEIGLDIQKVDKNLSSSSGK